MKKNHQNNLLAICLLIFFLGRESIANETATEGDENLTEKAHPVYFPITYAGTISAKKNMRLISSLHFAAAINMDVVLYIDSAGGDLDSTFAVYQVAKRLPIKIKTVAVSRVQSAAFLMFCIGVERYATETATFMIHPIQFSGLSITKESSEDTRFLLYEEAQARLFDECFSDKKWRKIYSDMPKTYFGPKDAKRLGAINSGDLSIFTPFFSKEYKDYQMISDD